MKFRFYNFSKRIIEICEHWVDDRMETDFTLPFAKIITILKLKTALTSLEYIKFVNFI